MSAASPTEIHRLVQACRDGTHPGVIARLSSGWAVMGLRQVLPGYCLLLPDPVVGHLNALTPAARDRFMSDLGALGEAVLAVTGAVRINYAIFGNVEPALHAHVHPRYADEPEAHIKAHPWSYDWERAPEFDPQQSSVMCDAIAAHLRQQAVI